MSQDVVVEPRYSYRLILTLSVVVSVAYGALYYSFSVLITRAGAGQDFSTSVLSLAYGGAVLTGGAAAIPLGRLADRRGVRGILGLGSVLGAAGLAAFATARESWQVVATWWLLLGPATAMTFYEPAYVAIGQWFRSDDRPRAIASMTLLAGLSGPIFIPATDALVQTLGWRLATLVLGVLLGLTGSLAALVILPDQPRLGRAREPTARPLVTTRAPRFLIFTLGAVLAYGAVEASVIHRVARFEEAGFAVASVSTWAALSGLLTLPGRFVLPALSVRVPGTAILTGVLLVLALATAFALDGSLAWEMAVYFGLFGLVFGAALPLRAVIMSDWYAGRDYGAIMGLQAALIAVGRAAGPPLIGVLRDMTSSYRLPMLVVLLALLASALLILSSGWLRGAASRS
jgi:MFS family permease